MSTRKSIPLDKLVVNWENYRFDPVDNQEEAIDLMLEEKGDEILALAKHIYENGFDLARDLRVQEIKKDLYLALDGNRRLTAAKCLKDLSHIKNDDLRAKFARIEKGKGVVPDEVSCIIYSNEKDAAKWIKLDHTGKNGGQGQDQWDAAQKDRFDFKFSGKKSPAAHVLDFFQAESKKKIDTKKLKISTINRIISNPESRSYLGIAIRNGSVHLLASKKDVMSRLDKLFNKLIVDNVPVREVYHTPDSIKFMQKLFGAKPKYSKRVLTVTSTGTTQPAKQEGQKILPKSGDRKFLIPKECSISIPEPKINNIYHELRSVPLDGATNAIGVLFRVFLETTIDYFAQKKGITFSEKATLGTKITRVTNDLEKAGVASPAQLKAIRTVPAKGNSILSIENFHGYVHSFNTQPVPLDLIYKWDNLQEFFEIIWVEAPRKRR